MSWTRCPVCSQQSPPSSIRCSSCGADFSDPDVRAMLAAPDQDQPAPDLGPAGSLTASRFLGFSIDGLTDGSSLRRLALLGCGLLVIAFLIPVSTDFVDFVPVWSALDSGNAVTLLYPAAAIILGAISAVATGLTPWLRGLLLAVAGLAGLATLPWQASLAGAPDKFLPVVLLGVAVGGAGLALRIAHPMHNGPRYLLIAGAAIGAMAMLIPVSEAERILPVELRFYLSDFLGDASPVGAVRAAFRRDPLVLFSSAYLLLPLVLLPLAAVLAWPKPTGVWDKSNVGLRPLAWCVVLYAPLGFALFALNLMGWKYVGRVAIDHQVVSFDDFVTSAILGRLRLLPMSFAFAIWTYLSAFAIYARFATGHAETDAASAG